MNKENDYSINTQILESQSTLLLYKIRKAAVKHTMVNSMMFWVGIELPC